MLKLILCKINRFSVFRVFDQIPLSSRSVQKFSEPHSASSANDNWHNCSRREKKSVRTKQNFCCPDKLICCNNQNLAVPPSIPSSCIYLEIHNARAFNNLFLAAQSAVSFSVTIFPFEGLATKVRRQTSAHGNRANGYFVRLSIFIASDVLVPVGELREANLPPGNFLAGFRVAWPFDGLIVSLIAS